MPTAFAAITERILNHFGNDPVCAHVGDVQMCTIKKHPTYQELRAKVYLGREKTKGSLRIWESVVTLAKEGDQQEQEKWLLIALDLLTRNFEGWSAELAREWRHDVSDIRSAMIEGLLEAWFSASSGASANQLLNEMKSRAFFRARTLVNTGSSETCTDAVNYWIPEGGSWDHSTLRPSSILDAGTVRDPDADERIRGERIGALLQRMGAMDHVTRVHNDIRDGRRDVRQSPHITPSQVGRAWIDGKNIYYRFSDLLPQHIGYKEAAETVGLSKWQASNRSGKGSAPFRVRWIGNSRVVAVHSLMELLEIPDPLLHPDDVENGAAHVKKAA
ncbi:hypothetical protein ACWCPO_28660 [Streptomyces albidoflavus]